MVKILITLLFVILILQHVYIYDLSGLIEALIGAMAPEIINYILEWWNQGNTLQPYLYLRYIHNGRTRSKQVDINKIDPTTSIYAQLHTRAGALVINANKDDYIFMSQCEMLYKSEDIELLIYDEESSWPLLERIPDTESNKRFIDIICYEVDPRSKMVRNAYNYQTNTGPTVSEKESAQQSLKDANFNLGAYNVESAAVQMFGVKDENIPTKIMDVANKYGWDEKMMIIIKTVPSAGSLFETRCNVKFDAGNWIIFGFCGKIAGWKSDVDDNKCSMYIATSKYVFNIPRELREGNVMDKYLGGEGGTVSPQYIEFIEIILRYQMSVTAQRGFTIQID